jgi:diguanylate cyclase (GGDEF)-like protein
VPGDTSLVRCPAPGITGSWEQAVQVAALRREVACLRREVARAWAVASTDELTGVGNRRALLARLDQAQTTGEQVGLLLADLDAFKAINDTYGHGVGDHVLRVVAQRLAQAAGPGCLVARLGGDEFAIAVATASHDEVDRLTERVQDALAAGPVVVGRAQVTVTASVGATITRPGDDGPSDLLARADARMYDAKIAHHTTRDEGTR